MFWRGVASDLKREIQLMDFVPMPFSDSTRKLQAPESNRATDRMKVSSVPTGLQVLLQ